MGQFQGSGSLVDLIRACTGAGSVPVLLETVLPKVRRDLGALTTVVVTDVAGEHEHAFVDGVAVPPAALAAPPDGVRGVVLVPDEWRETGVGHLVAQRLPAHHGVLAIGWASPDEARARVAELQVVLDLFDLALARLVTRTELADLAHRVDNAQHLASMGDYDWHIASDTNRWSDELYRIYGYEPQSFNASYERFLANIHPDDRERIQAVHQEAYASGAPYRMVERIVRPDGELRYLSSNGEVVMDADGNPERMRGTCIDITERVLADEQREHAAATFRALVEAGPEAILVVDEAAVVLQANERAATLLGADPAGRPLVDFLPQGRRGGRATPAHRGDGSDLVLDVTTAHLTEVADAGLTAIFLVDAAPRLEREAMATRLGESLQRRRQALEINDNVVQGLTAAAYALDKEDLRTTRSYLERTLTAARAMMDDLLDPAGQQIRPGELVRSQPAALAPPIPLPAPSAVVPDPTVPRVLIVDDAEDIRALLRLRIASRGEYDVVGEAADGVDAVEQTRRLQPDVVLLDMAMPRMDGLEALPLIRAAAPQAHVIVLSGFNQSTLADEAMAAGAERYVVKGGSMSDLLDVIAEVVQAA